MRSFCFNGLTAKAKTSIAHLTQLIVALSCSLVKMLMGLLNGQCRIEPQDTIPGAHFTLVFTSKVSTKPEGLSSPQIDPTMVPASQPLVSDAMMVSAAMAEPTLLSDLPEAPFIDILTGPCENVVVETHGSTVPCPAIAPWVQIATPVGRYSSVTGWPASSEVSLTRVFPSGPVAAPTPVSANGSGVTSPFSLVRGMHVLVVDDVAMVRNVTTRLLQQKGARGSVSL
jgi:hypothetical protein